MKTITISFFKVVFTRACCLVFLFGAGLTMAHTINTNNALFQCVTEQVVRLPKRAVWNSVTLRKQYVKPVLTILHVGCTVMLCKYMLRSRCCIDPSMYFFIFMFDYKDE